VDTKSLAPHPAPPPTTDLLARRAAMLQRTTRGLLTFNTGRVHRLEGGIWAVPSTRGGFYRVDLGDESCPCEDFTFFGRDHGIGCRHDYAAAIARASCRSKRRECSACFAGYISITVVHDGEEHDEPVRCRRCALDAGDVI
jgi:hypothetical protein